MSVHLLKPALGILDCESFQLKQKQWYMRYRGGMAYPVWTSRKPSRAEELLNGGSVFWIIKGQILCRQPIIALENYPAADDEKPSYLVMCAPELIRVMPQVKKPFQGWRYLEESQAPQDICREGEGDAGADISPEMLSELREAGLL